VILSVLPLLTSMLVFGVYSALHGIDVTGKDSSKLTVAKVYTVLVLFNLMQVPMRLLVMAVVGLVDALASLERMSKLYGYGEKSF
jgi:hypothetical protein